MPKSFEDAVMVRIRAWAKYDLSTFSGQLDIFKYAALHLPKQSIEKEIQFDSADVTMLVVDLQYQAFTLTVMKNNFECRAVTGNEISFQRV